MLAIRMQRTGRKGHAMFRVIVQDARRTPTSGNVVAQIGHYDPHTKAVTLDKEKTLFYLEHGAQPSERIAELIRSEKIKLPKWVAARKSKQGKVRNPEKLQKDVPKPASVVAEPEISEPAVVAPETEAITEVPEAEPDAETEPTAEAPDTVEAAEVKPEEAEVITVAPEAEPVAESEITAEASDLAEVKPEAEPAEPVTDETPAADQK